MGISRAAAFPRDPPMVAKPLLLRIKIGEQTPRRLHVSRRIHLKMQRHSCKALYAMYKALLVMLIQLVVSHMQSWCRQQQAITVSAASAMAVSRIRYNQMPNLNSCLIELGREQGRWELPVDIMLLSLASRTCIDQSFFSLLFGALNTVGVSLGRSAFFNF